MATTTVATRQVHEILQDYKICLTGASDKTSEFESHTKEVVNPEGWPTDRHRVPPYRPINRELDPKERTLGTNIFETTFLIVMFSGVVTNAVRHPRYHQTWRSLQKDSQ